MTVPVSSPSEQGVDPGGIAAFVDALEAAPLVEPHGLIVHRHGHRIAEGYWAPHTTGRSRLVYSLSKTFTGTALALQVGEGRLALDDLVADHLPDLLEGADAVTRRMRIRHIASMSSGHDHEMLSEAMAADPTDPVRGFFAIPPAHEPGTVFAYNQPPVLALAMILQRRAGQTLTEYLRPRLTDPLGIADLRWASYRPGLELGFSGVYTDLDAVARLGQLYLDDGVRTGAQILPRGWVAQASSPLVPSPGEPQVDWRQGYGLQLWRSRHGYRGDGAFGQFMLVLPEQDAVVAIFSATEQMQAVLDAVWAHLLPAMTKARGCPGPADEALAERLGHLRLPTARERIGGTAPRFASMGLQPSSVGENSQPTLTAINLDGDWLTLHEGDTTTRVPLSADWTLTPSAPVAASAAQNDTALLTVDLVFVDTPHRLELTADLTSSLFSTDWATRPMTEPGTAIPLADLHRPPR